MPRPWKVCPECGVKKIISFFTNAGGVRKGEPGSYCKPCASKKAREYKREYKKKTRTIRGWVYKRESHFSTIEFHQEQAEMNKHLQKATLTIIDS